jgi:cytoskeleton protein RodZ
MPEIGSTLREARMRHRIDISEIEAQTKIRAKYLRALENEEWDLLPGPTYVKSFLRTYADELGLDGKRLVEEYKLQFERLSDVELQPIAPPGQRRNAAQQRSNPWKRVWIAVVVLVIIGGALYFLGRGGNDGNGSKSAATTNTTRTETQTQPKTTTTNKKTPAKKTKVKLQVQPQAAVYVCLEADGKPVINQQVLEPGANSDTFKAKRFDITLGNGSAIIKVNGKAFNVPDSSNPVGYRFTPKGRTELTEAQRPTCNA